MLIVYSHTSDCQNKSLFLLLKTCPFNALIAKSSYLNALLLLNLSLKNAGTIQFLELFYFFVMFFGIYLFLLLQLISNYHDGELIWNFQRSWFLAVEFPKDITQFLEFPGRWSFGLSGISRGKVKKCCFQKSVFQKNGVFQKSMSSTTLPCLFFFSE